MGVLILLILLWKNVALQMQTEGGGPEEYRGPNEGAQQEEGEEHDRCVHAHRCHLIGPDQFP